MAFLFEEAIASITPCLSLSSLKFVVVDLSVGEGNIDWNLKGGWGIVVTPFPFMFLNNEKETGDFQCKLIIKLGKCRHNLPTPLSL